MIRFFDILISFFALLILSPILLITSLLLKLTGEGEVFFIQQRIGSNGVLFNLIKFATMLKDSPLIGTGEITLANDPRVLPLGKYLRKSKINEIPQLYNVLRGDMSLIGYRPQTPKYWDCFEKDHQKILKHQRPGLSGMSSVLLRDEEKYLENFSDPVMTDEKILMPFKGRVEAWYAENKTLNLYFKLILLTIFKVFRPNSSVFFGLIEKMPAFQKELENILDLQVKG